ncbi:GNAT family N-acetyltransferase [Riemerella anatipestifer]|uniref:GNAT family N-acetyltransferase n=1 Tax=Riemerella anatipestifer TaxID=34085 RepID=UPI0030BF8D04
MIEIRKATIKDLKFIVELFDQYRVFYENKSDKIKAEEFIAERLKLDDSKIFVAETDDKSLVGFVQLYPLFSSTRMKRLWLLNDLFVDNEFRGKGLSKMLIEKSKELCSQTNACGLILETAKTNVIGNELYPKVGFSLDKEHNYYSWDNN